MNITRKKALLLAAVLIVMIPTVIVFAQPLGIGKEKGHSRLLLMGQGFALNPQNGSDYHVLDVSAVVVNRSNSSTKTMSYLRFAGQAYALNITGYDNQSLAGNVFTLPLAGTNKTDFNPQNVGNIRLSMLPKEGVLFSTGTLTISGTNYNVLLTSPVMAWGGVQHNFNGIGRRGFTRIYGRHNPER